MFFETKYLEFKISLKAIQGQPLSHCPITHLTTAVNTNGLMHCIDVV